MTKTEKRKAEAKVNRAIDAMIDLSSIVRDSEIQRILDALNLLRGKIESKE